MQHGLLLFANKGKGSSIAQSFFLRVSKTKMHTSKQDLGRFMIFCVFGGPKCVYGFQFKNCSFKRYHNKLDEMM